MKKTPKRVVRRDSGDSGHPLFLPFFEAFMKVGVHTFLLTSGTKSCAQNPGRRLALISGVCHELSGISSGAPYITS